MSTSAAHYALTLNQEVHLFRAAFFTDELNQVYLIRTRLNMYNTGGYPGPGSGNTGVGHVYCPLQSGEGKTGMLVIVAI